MEILGLFNLNLDGATRPKNLACKTVSNETELLFCLWMAVSACWRSSDVVVWMPCNVCLHQTVLYRIHLVVITILYDGGWVNFIFTVGVSVTRRRRWWRPSWVSTVVLLAVVVKTGLAPPCNVLHLLHARLIYLPLPHAHSINILMFIFSIFVPPIHA